MPDPSRPSGPPLADGVGYQQPPGRNRAAGWAKLGASLGIVGAEGTADYLHPTLIGVLALVDIIPLVVVLIVFIVIVKGSERTCERTFRLLRWIVNRPEPPAPDISIPDRKTVGGRDRDDEAARVSRR
jgi:hypothetical protein